ncbi:type II secretion system F family protein [Patescibacteria group bacterium]|nr:MAG: type II secretion system F family protein [Patescibacteria group bacterium]
MAATSENPAQKPAADAKGKRRSWLPRLGIPLAQKIFFVENLRVMVRAGLSYTQAFETLILQAEKKRWRLILQDIAKRLERGESFAGALTHHEDFPPFFVSMVRVGEVSGTLEKSLEELGLQMKKELTMRGKIRGALMYPAITLSATVLISIALFIFVVPRILDIFKEFKAELPLPTKILLAVSQAITTRGPLVALGVLLFVALLVYLARTPGGRTLLHWTFLRFYIIGPIVKKVNLARALRTLATLLRTGIPVIEAFQITSEVVGNVHYQKALVAAEDELRRGTKVGESFAKYPRLFPPLVIQMTTVGEQSGKLDEMLGEVANFYEAQVDSTLSNLTQIIEPLLILILGAAVAGIAVAIISPIYTLSETI